MIKKYFLVWMLVLALVVPVITMARENDDSPQDEDDQEEMDDSGQDSESDQNDDDEDNDNDDNGNDDSESDSETVAELRAKIAELMALIARLQGNAPNPSRGECTLSADFARDLFFGDQDFGSNKSIEALQKALAKRGLLNMPQGAAYGFFGNLTRIALERFQIQNGISEKYKDGYAYVGPQTRRALSGCSGQNPTRLAPTCSLSSNKSSYSLGETITYYWTSQNATYASWQQDNSGKDHLWLPGDKLSANGSQQVTASVIGNPPVTLMVGGVNNGTGSCTKVVNVTAGGHNNNLPPIIHGVSGPTSLKVGERGTWTVKATDPENGSLRYSARWGDEATSANETLNGSGSQQSVTFSHVYGWPNGSSKDTYRPTFTVTDNNGLSAVTSVTVSMKGESSSSITCTGLEMVWPENNIYNRREPYTYQNDLCDGYRIVRGNTITPSCYNWNECQPQAAQNGGTCVNIASAKLQCQNTTPSNPNIRVTYPNGGERIDIGSDIKVKWSGNDSSVKVYIEKMYNGQFATAGEIQTSSNDYNNEWVLWNAKTLKDSTSYGAQFYNLSPGQYWVKVCYQNSFTCDYSDNYFVLQNAPSNDPTANYLKLRSPNGGETWRKGSSQEVSWAYGQSNWDIGIFLVPAPYTGSGTFIVRSANDAQQSVVVPEGLSEGNYKLKIECTNCSAQDLGTIDYSDSNIIVE